MPAKANARITRLGEALHPGITTDPHWPTLAQQLYVANQEGIRETELRRIATARPLPIDQPAAALTYRLVDAIGDRTPTTSTKAATARLIGDKPAPSEPTVSPTPVPVHRSALVRAAAGTDAAARLRADLRIGTAARPTPVDAVPGRACAGNSLLDPPAARSRASDHGLGPHAARPRAVLVPRRSWHRRLVYSAMGTGVRPDAGRCR